MAKRFTDTGKWNKPFLRGMKAPYKLLWIYILDECNHAGIWEIDLEVAELKIGEKLNKSEAHKFFNGKILEFENKWFIYDFIEFQYGDLNPANRVHNSVIQTLAKYKIDILNKPLISPLQGAKDKEKDKEKDMDKVKAKEKEPKKNNLILPFDSNLFKMSWDNLLTEKKWRNKSELALQASLKKLSNYSEDIAIKMIDDCIAGEWQGLVEPTNKYNNGKQTTNYKQQSYDPQAISALNNAIKELGK